MIARRVRRLCGASPLGEKNLGLGMRLCPAAQSDESRLPK